MTVPIHCSHSSLALQLLSSVARYGVQPLSWGIWVENLAICSHDQIVLTDDTQL